MFNSNWFKRGSAITAVLLVCVIFMADIVPGGAPLASPVFTGVVTVPAGTVTAAGLVWAGDTAGAGMYRPAAVTYAFTGGTNEFLRFTSGSVRTVSGSTFGFTSSSTSSTGGADTAISRIAADVMGFGNGGQGDTSGRVKAAAYMSLGATFTSNAGCSETTLVGGATAGKFTAVSTSCTVIITFGNTSTAPNGWSCWAHDLTTSADYNNPHTSSTTTTLTIVTGTIVSSDVIEFGCVGY